MDIEHLQHLGWGVLEERLHEELHLVDEKCIGVHLKSHCKREERDKQERVEGSDTRSASWWQSKGDAAYVSYLWIPTFNAI